MAWFGYSPLPSDECLASSNARGSRTAGVCARASFLKERTTVLLLWCTGPHVAIGTHVKIIEAWGFKSSTVAFVWVKENKTDGRVRTRGQGCWTASNAEYVILGIKGSPFRLATDVHQVVLAPVGEHSTKPEEVRRRIERLFPGPYLELYGRKLVPEWTVWGNEIPRDRFEGGLSANSITMPLDDEPAAG